MVHMAGFEIKINTGKSSEDKTQGFCSRCGNFSSNLVNINMCPTCDAKIEKQIIKPSEKSYIKAGKRKHVGL